MDRAQAALNPEAADLYNTQRLGDRLLQEEAPPEEILDPNRPRTAFKGVAQDLRDEYEADISSRLPRDKVLWDAV